MKKLQAIVAAGIVSLGLGVGAFAPLTFAAECSSPSDCVNKGVSTSGGNAAKTDLNGLIKIIVNVLLFIIGAVSVIMIILGGIKYTVSQGDSSQVQSAKNTVLYAVIGLIVAILAYAIVQFVTGQFLR